MYILLDGGNIDDVDILAITKRIASNWQGMESDMTTGQGFCLWQEAKDIPAAINNDILLGYIQKVLKFSNIAKKTLGAEFCNYASNKCLLAVGSI